MYHDNLSKEEIKAVKKGYAYRSWQKRQRLTYFIAFAWFFGGIPLAHMNDITNAIYFVGIVLVLILEFRVLLATSWKCPKCNAKLPSKEAIGGSATVPLPFLIRTCPHCGLDLTTQRRDMSPESRSD